MGHILLMLIKIKKSIRVNPENCAFLQAQSFVVSTARRQCELLFAIEH